MKTAIVILAVSVGMVGCATQSMQHFVSTDATTGKKVVTNVLVIRDGGIILGTDVTAPINQRCPIEALDVEKDQLDHTQCVTQHTHGTGENAGMTYDVIDFAHSTTFLKTVAPNAAIAGGVGAGLAYSGSDTTVNQSGGGANATGGNAMSSARGGAGGNASVNAGRSHYRR